MQKVLAGFGMFKGSLSIFHFGSDIFYWSCEYGSGSGSDFKLNPKFFPV